MSKCIRCGSDAYPRKICSSCLSNWSDMRTILFAHVQKVHGKMCQDNLAAIQKDTKRLDKLWRKDPDAFYREVEPQDNAEESQAHRTTQPAQNAEDSTSGVA